MTAPSLPTREEETEARETTSREPLAAAASRCIAELSAALALHRDDLASISIERTALASQLAQAEEALETAPRNSPHRRMVADAASLLRARLRASDQGAEIASRALRDCSMARDTLATAVPEAGDQLISRTATHGGRALFEVIEDERMRIARDMHDGPAQLLANLVLKAEIVERVLDHDPSLVRGELAEFKAIARVALDETRQLIFDLRPMTLDDLGLVPTLRNFLRDYERRWGIPCRFTMSGAERRLPRDREAALFRILQEALTNARRHATPSIIEVTVSMSPSRVTVTVRDDGHGFDIEAITRTAATDGHLGLISMQERATLAGAVLELASDAREGTTVRVTWAPAEPGASIPGRAAR